MLLRTILLVAILVSQIPADGLAADAGVGAPPPMVTRSAGVPSESMTDGPVSRDEYIVGPGDAFVLSIWGERSISVPLAVGPEGRFVLPEGGTLRVAGLTLAQAEHALVSRLAPYYHDVEMTLTLASSRRAIVHVTGAVANPGSYDVPATLRVSGLLSLAGDELPRAALRSIQVRGEDGSVRLADLVLYRRQGELAANPLVAAGRVVHVPFMDQTIEVRGAVNVPGEYELLPGERVSDALRIAGGLREFAELSSVELVRFSKEQSDEYESLTVDLSSDQNLELQNGDRIHVRSIEGWHKLYRVEIEGEVAFPGYYSVVEGEDRLNSVFERAGGVTGFADLAGAMLLRSPSSDSESAADRELALLASGDRVSMTNEEFEYLRSSTVEPVGLVSVDFHALIMEGDVEQDVLLYGGDVIHIPRRSNLVRVSGAVERPGFVEYVSGASASDYIRAAGGYTNVADKRRARVVRSVSGQRLRASWAVRPDPGDSVIVPRREETDWLEVGKDFLSIASQVATIYILIQGIQSN